MDPALIPTEYIQVKTISPLNKSFSAAILRPTVNGSFTVSKSQNLEISIRVTREKSIPVKRIVVSGNIRTYRWAKT